MSDGPGVGKLKLVVVTGPTASGKTEASLALAERLSAEIVSADSMQVYRGLDIGTAKPTPEERRRVPHHLIDVADIDEPYHVGRFRAEAARAIADIHGRGRACLVVGGTALYLKILLSGLAEGPGRDEAVRADLTDRWERGENLTLWQELQEADPRAAARLHPNDKTRVIRALEVWRATGVSLSELQERHGFSGGDYDALILGMRVERDELNRRIDARVRRMLEAGWAEEVAQALSRGYDPNLPPLCAIGYRELCRYLREGGDLDAVAAEIAQATRKFAKRQMTWFRKMKIEWFDPLDVDAMTERARIFLQ
jgi:tRNA dimethylallyltransferase